MAAVAVALLTLLIIWLPGPAPASPTKPSAATPANASGAVAVSGVVFYDKNDNGVRDPGEPGLAGINLHNNSGSRSTTTAADGSYTLSDLAGSKYVQVETGWFRAQCPSLIHPTGMSCAAGPGADEDFYVDNQFVRYAVAGGSATDLDVGLLPDWPGRSMTPPAAVNTVIPSNPVDVAARLSWSSGTCLNSTYEICRVGDRFAMSGQILNQGTTALTGIQARVYVPPGDCLRAAALLTFTVPVGIGALTVSPTTPTCATRYLDLSLAGTLPPGAAVRIAVSGKTVAGPGTPGCNPKKINTALCPSLEPQGRGWLFGITHIDQTGDPDSTFCAAGDMTQCALGLHDKRRAPDEIDPAGHNVDSTLSRPHDYNLVARVALLDAHTVRAFVSNPTNAPSPGRTTVKIWLPAGTVVVAVPAKHVLILCNAGKIAGNAVVVTCVLGGPVAPTLSSPAIDLTLATTPVRAVVCVTPAAGSSDETVPAGSHCGYGTDPTTTVTDNDAIITS